jgi:predicted SprT family Zn-dependent metalloprotease
MKLIFDESLSEVDNSETKKIRQRKIFHCSPCKTYFTRGQVDKKVDKYYCPNAHCGKEVVEKTDGDTGRNLMEIINL